MVRAWMLSDGGCRETNFGAGTRLGNKVPLVKWPRPQMPKWMDAETYNALPDYLQVREIEVDGRVRWAMAKATLLSQILPRALSFIGAKRTLGILEEHRRHHGGKREGRMIAIARAAIATLKLPHRPHRVEPRAKKRRPKPLPLLTTTCGLARQLIMDQRTLKVVS